NGVVERCNRTLIEAAYTMLIYTQAPLFLWAKVVATACFIQNRSIIRLRHGKTPYELLHNCDSLALEAKATPVEESTGVLESMFGEVEVSTDGFSDFLICGVRLTYWFWFLGVTATGFVPSSMIIGQNQSSTSGTLSSNTIPILKGEMKAITTRSGVTYKGPAIPTPKKVVKRETEETTDKEQTNFQGSTSHIQPSVVLISEPDVTDFT
nr:putative ribonuclease H-like domain-containing protein [Tanacetum cinerariifolium]